MAGKGKKKSKGIQPLKVLAAILLIAAIVKELRLPPEERTWHGTLGDFVPYDLRMPTMERIKTTFWDPEGAVIVGRPFGVGWTINFGGAVARLRAAAEAGAD